MNILREKYHLELEMSYPFYAVAMTSVCDTAEGFERLSKALLEIDKCTNSNSKVIKTLTMPKPKSSGLSTADALELSDSEANRQNIGNKYIYAYPPGIPIIIPGEVIDGDIIRYIENLKLSGITVNGI